MENRSRKLLINSSIYFLFSIFYFLAPFSAHAERRGDQGVGLMLGNPSGLSYKMFLNEDMAFDAAAGIDRGEFDVHTTFLYHMFDLAKKSENPTLKNITAQGELPVYFGIGPRLLFAGHTEFGVRLPVGVSYYPKDTLWEFFGEVAPVIRFTPDSGFNGDFAIGARYYFPAIRPMQQGQ